MLRKPTNKPELHYKYKSDHYGVSSEIALPIMDESFTPDQIRSSYHSPEQLKEYCKKLLEAFQISEERYISIVGEASKLPMVPITEEKKPPELDYQIKLYVAEMDECFAVELSDSFKSYDCCFQIISL